MIRPEQIRFVALDEPRGAFRRPRARDRTPATSARTRVVRLRAAPTARTPIAARTFDLDVPAAGELVEHRGRRAGRRVSPDGSGGARAGG